jgi:hypothetical protein
MQHEEEGPTQSACALTAGYASRIRLEMIRAVPVHFFTGCDSPIFNV